MTRYTNPWYKPGKPEYGPAEYVTDAPSRPHRGFDIYDRWGVFDVVKDGACVGQFAGYGGATGNIDAYLDGAEVHYLEIPKGRPEADVPVGRASAPGL